MHPLESWNKVTRNFSQSVFDWIREMLVARKIVLIRRYLCFTASKQLTQCNATCRCTSLLSHTTMQSTALYCVLARPKPMAIYHYTLSKIGNSQVWNEGITQASNATHPNILALLQCNKYTHVDYVQRVAHSQIVINDKFGPNSQSFQPIIVTVCTKVNGAF